LKDKDLVNAEAAFEAAVVLIQNGDTKLARSLGILKTPSGSYVKGQVIELLESRVIPEELDAGRTFDAFQAKDLAPGGKHSLYLLNEIRSASERALNFRQQIALDFFTSPAGGSWSKAQAAGIVGNLTEESYLDPQKKQGGGPGFGIAQWNPNDSRGKAFAAVVGVPLTKSDFMQQLRFITTELTTKLAGTTIYKSAGDLLRTAKTPFDAGVIFANKFERMNPRLVNQPTIRGNNAAAIYREFFVK
jgi:hypothetical protein